MDKMTILIPAVVIGFCLLILFVDFMAYVDEDERDD